MDPIDRAWHVWIVSILAAMLLTIGLLAFVVVPVMNAGQEGLDAFSAICRAIGLPVGKGTATARPAGGQLETAVAWTAPERAALERADKVAGQELAQANCVACHAADGSTPDPAIPRMAGQTAYAIDKQLQDFQSGARRSDTMSEIAHPLSAKQMADLAAYYASLHRTDIDVAHPSFAGPEIEELALRGDARRALPPCGACHGEGTGGPLETPSLTGQSPNYVTAQLHAFADGSRHNDVFERMRSIAGRLTPREMELLGAYYATPH